MAKTLFDNSSSLINKLDDNDETGKAESYGIGEEMVSFNPTLNAFSNFLLPQRDMLGYCDNFRAPGFMKNIDGASCLQNKSIGGEFLKWQTYVGDFPGGRGSLKGTQNFLKGSLSKFTKSSVKLGNVFDLQSTGKITQKATGTAPTGQVKEVFYRVYYSAVNGRYIIDDVYADFVMQSSAGAGTLFEQKFGIEFKPSTADLNATENKPTGSNLVYRSGNPGYELNEPLIVGISSGIIDVERERKNADGSITKIKTLDHNGLGKDVRFGGYGLYAADQKGNCYDANGP